MAQPTSEKKTFKWGDQEYLLDDLLKLHSEQFQNYENFAQARGNYKGDSLISLRNSINDRINAAKSGKIFSADGSLDTDTVNNVTILSDKKRLAKKGVGTNQDTTEWSKYYISKLVGQLKPYTKDTSDTDWNPEKHGFSAYLTGQGVNAQDVFEQYDLRDPNNPTAARSYKERKDLLKTHLTGYQQWLTDKGFDFTKNSSEWDDSTMADLTSLLTNYDSMDNRALSTSLRKLGAGDIYTTAFTSDRWDMSTPAADSIAAATAEAERKREADEAALFEKYMKEAQDTFLDSYTRSEGSYYSPYDYSASGKSSFMDYYTSLTSAYRRQHGSDLGSDPQTWQNAYQSLMTSFKGGTPYTDKNANIVLQRFFENAPNGFTDVGGGLYAINQSLTDMGHIHVYDPKSGYVQKRHISEFANSNADLKAEYENLLYNYINNKYKTSYKNRSYVSFAKGGIIKAQLGTAVLQPYSVNDQHKAKADAKGIDVATQKAKEAPMLESDTSLANPEGGWETKHFLRLGYAITDLGSAIAAFLPGYGTAASAGLGLTSTFGNLFTDLADDAVTGKEAWRNFGLNIGLDVLGLIPAGGAASKMGKIVKTLKTTVPLIVALPGVANMLSNSPEIAASWRKAFDGRTEDGGESMTYQDYMNVLQVLNVASGIVGVAGKAKKSAQVSKPTDKLAVSVTDKHNQRKVLVFEGDDVAKFKEADARGEAQSFVDDFEGAGNYTVQKAHETHGLKFWGKDAEGNFEWRRPFGSTETNRAQTYQVNTEKVRSYAGYGPYASEVGSRKVKKGYSPFAIDASGEKPVLTRDYLTDADDIWVRDYKNTDFISTAGGESVSGYKSRRQGEIDADIKQLRETAKAFAETRAGKVAELETVDADLRTHTTRKTTADAELVRKQAELDQTRARQQEIHDWLNGGEAAAKAERVKLLKKLEDLDFEYKTATRSKKPLIKDEIADVQGQIRKIDEQIRNNTSEAQRTAAARETQLQTEVTTLQTEITKLEGMLSTLGKKKKRLTSQTSKHSDAYKALRDFKPIEETFKGQTLTFNPSEVIDFTDLYKQGGPINRNKLNKFINYAKG